jgi:membrane protease YdiL (CAAX protease family)
MAVNVLSFGFSIPLWIVGLLVVWFFPKFNYALPERIRMKSARLQAVIAVLLVLYTAVFLWELYSFLPRSYLNSFPRSTEELSVLGAVLFVGSVFVVLLIFGEKFSSVRLRLVNMRYSIALALILAALLLVPVAVFDPIFVSRLAKMNLVLFGTLVLENFAEEILFRGFLQTRLEGMLGANRGIICTAVLFLLWHYPAWTIVFGYTRSLFLYSVLFNVPGSLLLSYLANKSGNVWCTTIVHIANDIPVLLLP